MPLTWTVDAQASDEDLQVVSESVFSHGRAQAWDGQLGYRSVAVVPGYVGRFNRHTLVKPLAVESP